MATNSDSFHVFITDQKTVGEQSLKAEYSIPALDGGRIITGFDNADDNNFPFPVDLVSRKIAANGSLGPEITLVTESVTTNADFADIAVSGGGAVYVVDISQNIMGARYLTFQLDYIDASGQDARTTLDSFAFNDSPLPFLLPSHPTLTHYSNETFTVGWTEKYTEANPDFGSFEYPTTTASFMRLYADNGTLLNTVTVNFDGLRETDTYAATGTRTQAQLMNTNGTSDITSYNAITGKETGEFIRNLDGSRTEVNLAVTGKSYTAQTASYDAVGHLISMTRTYANGVTAFKQVVESDGSQAVANFDTTGRETTSIAFAIDGSRDVTLRSYTGTSRTPSTVEIDHYGANNKIASSNVTNTDGSHKQTAFAAGVSLTSTTDVADTLTAASVGGNTFVFKPAFGQDIITNFHAGASVNHDVADFTAFHVQLGSAQSQADYLAQHLQQVGNAAVLTIAPNEIITLKNTLVASLTNDNVRI